MAICDLPSNLPDSICWKQVMKDALYARGEKLNSTFWSRNVRNFVKPFVKTITHSSCSPCVFLSTIPKVKSHSFWFLLLEHKFHERRYLVFFTALSPATQTATLNVFSHRRWFVYLIKLFSLQNSVEFPFTVVTNWVHAGNYRSAAQVVYA